MTPDPGTSFTEKGYDVNVIPHKILSVIFLTIVHSAASRGMVLLLPCAVNEHALETSECAKHDSTFIESSCYERAREERRGYLLTRSTAARAIHQLRPYTPISRDAGMLPTMLRLFALTRELQC